MLKKRAQGLSINVIIIVAIALIVLVVLIAIFTGNFGIFTSGINKVLIENVPKYVSEDDGDPSPGDSSAVAGQSNGKLSCEPWTCVPNKEERYDNICDTHEDKTCLK